MLSPLTILTLSAALAAAAGQDETPEPARYVRIELPGANRILSLAEVQVFSKGESIAVGGVARQSSEASGGAPGRAVDGDTNGTYTSGSVTHTTAQRDAWWEVDLGELRLIDRIVVWNRTDCCDERLRAFTIQLLDKRHRVLWERVRIPKPRPNVEIRPFMVAEASPIGPTPEVRRAFQPRIDLAIDTGTEFLLSRQLWDGSFAHHSDQYPSGSTGLALYTLLKCGVPRDHPAVRRALHYLVAHPPTQTYELGTVLMALGALGEHEHDAYMESLLDELLSLQGAKADDGKTDDLWAYPNISLLADLSNTQYAALGLRAAQHAGLKVPARVWKGLASGTLRYQEDPHEVEDVVTKSGSTTGKMRIAGFPYRAGGPPTASMTTAGLCIIGICEEALGESAGGMRRKFRNAKKQGLGWLAYNFSVETNIGGGASWVTYYLYGLERVGALLDTDEIGGHDWYWEGAQFLVSKQGGNGSWSTDNESDSCFALLFLSRATARPGTGKEADRSAPEGAWISDDPGLDIQWRITGGNEGTFFISGFSEVVQEEYARGEGSARGLHVQSVEYLIDGESMATIPGDPEHKWRGERFATQLEFTRRGSYRCEVRVLVQTAGETEGSTTTIELLGEPLTVVIKDAHDASLLEFSRHSVENLLRRTQVSASASTENTLGQSAARAVDGRLGSAWLTKKDDPAPHLRLELERPQRGQILLLTQVNSHEGARGAHDRATRIRVVLNGKKSLTFDLDVPPTDEHKCRLELKKKIALRTVEITILERAKGSKWPGHIGFSEVEWLKRP